MIDPAWVGLLFSVIIFSTLLGDHRLARLAQYGLVGLSMGYLGVLAVQFGLRPLFGGMLTTGGMQPQRWAMLLLALLLLLAGCERIFSRGRGDGAGARGSLLRWLGLIPLGLMIGVGVATALIGAVQVTIVPQTWTLITGVDRSGIFASGSFNWLLGLILSAGVLFHLSLHPERHLRGQFAPLRQLLQLWMWVGQRALWLAAGIFFARIFAARYTLLISLIEQWRVQIEASGVLRW